MLKNSKNRTVKKNINTNVNANVDNIYHNSNAKYDHDFAQSPVDIISDELIRNDAISSDDVKSCKFDVELLQIINSIMFAKRITLVTTILYVIRG